MERPWNIGMLMGISGAYWQGCTLQAGVRLQVFTYLGKGPRTAEQVAQAAGTDRRATAMLLNALTAMGLVEKTGESYANSDFSKTFLVIGGERYMGHIILHHHHILDGWAQLDQAVRTGKKVARRSYGEAIERESFLMGMYNIASGIAPKIAGEFSLTGRRRLLDLGGGPGTYAIQFCLANPGLHATIFDRPATEPFARQTVARHGLAARIDFIGGDFNTDQLSGGPYDVAWLSHILHSVSVAQCRDCIAKVVAILEPGGLIMIHDFILHDSKDGPLFPALFSLNMLLGTDHGRSYASHEIITMLEQAGIGEICHRECGLPNDSSVIIGKKVV